MTTHMQVTTKAMIAALDALEKIDEPPTTDSGPDLPPSLYIARDELAEALAEYDRAAYEARYFPTGAKTKAKK